MPTPPSTATVKPDFSQVESDTAQISANERFRAVLSGKAPVLSRRRRPLPDADSRRCTRAPSRSPLWGGRITGKEGGVRYTRASSPTIVGGGSAILPGPNKSSLAEQDFGSTVFIARAKRDFGFRSSACSPTDRENHDGEGHSRLVGPDFQWRPSSADVVTGQLLFSESRAPNRPEVADEWTAER
jgi:hypothetical protein